MSRRGAVVVGIVIAAVVASLAALRLADGSDAGRPRISDSRPQPEVFYTPTPEAVRPASPPQADTTARGAERAQIDQLILIVKRSSVKGDALARDAAVDGLRRHGRPAIDALQEHLVRESNPAVARALTEALRRISS